MSSTQEVGDIFNYGSTASPLLRSPTVIIASIALWGMNIKLFQLFKIDHVKILIDSLPADDTSGLKKDPQHTKGKDFGERKSENGENESDTLRPPEQSELTAIKCFSFSALLYVLLHLNSYFCIEVWGLKSVDAIFIYYGFLIFVIALPSKKTKWIRDAFKVVIFRAMELLNPRCACITGDNPRPIPFMDVFFADGMCSMSKVFFDWGMLWHLASYYPNPVPVYSQNVILPSLCAAIPYLIRARQCLVMRHIGALNHDPKGYQHTLNAIKYSTSLFPICLSAYQQTVSEDFSTQLEYYLVLLLIVNSFYSYAWDVLMDWGMMQNPTLAVMQTCVPGESSSPVGCKAFLRPRLRFGVLLSSVILVADGIFRFGWILRFYSQSLFPSKDAYILFTELLEIFRRAIWNLLRVEWEKIKQNRKSEKEHEEDGDEETKPFIPPTPATIQLTTRT